MHKGLAFWKALSYYEGEVRNMKRIKLIVAILAAFTITVSGATYTLTSASYPINVNGQKLSVEPLNLNGNTYLPLRAISQAAGVPIEWDNAKKSVEITTVDVERLKEACVSLYDNGEFCGSGVYWDYNEVLTTYHMLKKGWAPDNTAEGWEVSKKDSDEETDSATLKSSERIKPVKIGDSDEIGTGDKVIIIASPQGNEDTVEYTEVIGPDPYGNGFMVMATMGVGASGGAVFDMNGCLVGILIASDGTTEHVRTRTLVSPINDIRKAL